MAATKNKSLKFAEILWIILNFLAIPFSYSPEEKPIGVSEERAKNVIKKWSKGNRALQKILTGLFLLIPLTLVIGLLALFSVIIFSISKEFLIYMSNNNYGFFEAIWNIFVLKI